MAKKTKTPSVSDLADKVDALKGKAESARQKMLASIEANVKAVVALHDAQVALETAKKAHASNGVV